MNTSHTETLADKLQVALNDKLATEYPFVRRDRAVRARVIRENTDTYFVEIFINHKKSPVKRYFERDYFENNYWEGVS